MPMPPHNPLNQATQMFRTIGDVAPESRRLRPSCVCNRNGDRVFVNVQPDVSLYFVHGLLLSLLTAPATRGYDRRILQGEGHTIWLFCGSDNGGNTAAVLFSLIATCQRHKIDPFAYLRDVLTRIAATPVSQLDQFLPDRWQPAQTAPTD